MRPKPEREAAREIEEKATPGPWEIEREELDASFSDYEQEHAMPNQIGPVFVEFVAEHSGGDDWHDRVEADAAFLAAARTHWPAAEAELDEAVLLLKEARKRLAFHCQSWDELVVRLNATILAYDGGDDV